MLLTYRRTITSFYQRSSHTHCCIISAQVQLCVTTWISVLQKHGRYQVTIRDHVIIPYSHGPFCAHKHGTTTTTQSVGRQYSPCSFASSLVPFVNVSTSVQGSFLYHCQGKSMFHACVISDFRRGLKETCSLLGFYAA
jgi:hypothetical protein